MRFQKALRRGVGGMLSLWSILNAYLLVAAAPALAKPTSPLCDSGSYRAAHPLICDTGSAAAAPGAFPGGGGGAAGSGGLLGLVHSLTGGLLG